MRSFILISFILLLEASICFSQKLETKEDFINSVYLTIVNSSFSQYYLSNDCFKLRFEKIEAKEIRSDFCKIIKDETFDELLKKSQEDTIPELWDCSRIRKAKCVSKDSSSIITAGINNIYYKVHWSKRRRRKEEAKQIAEQTKIRDKIPPEKKVVFYFSRPVFSNDGKYAMISLEYSCGVTCGQGCIFLFTKINGQWREIAHSGCQIS